MSEVDALLGDRGVRALIELALAEDVGPADVTSECLIPPDAPGRAVVSAREACRLAGGPVAAAVFRAMDDAIVVRLPVADGEPAAAGLPVLEAEGPLRSLLTAERTVLNFLQRMCGIATLTARYVERVQGTGVRILDTRKTTPGLRLIEKYAVTCGGGVNHRFGLYDRVMIKDNHLLGWEARRRSLPEAVREARRAHPGLLIQVEADTEEQVAELLEAGPDWILLDNMSLDALRRCVARCRGRCRTEASGGVTLDAVADIAATGVDAISVGALTHSAPAADLGLEVLPPA